MSVPAVGSVPQRTARSVAFGSQPATERDRTGCSLAFLNGAVRDFLTAHKMKLETLAKDFCEMSHGNLARMLSGAQGFPVALLDSLPDVIVTDFLERMQAHYDDPIVVATEQAVIANIRLLRALRGRRARSAKASL